MSAITSKIYFCKLDGSVFSGFAAIDSPVHHSPSEVLYLVKPSVVLLSCPSI